MSENRSVRALYAPPISWELLLVIVFVLIWSCGALVNARVPRSATADRPEQSNPPRPAPWKLGVHYELVENSPASSAAGSPIEVIEFFSYGCPHCYALEPQLTVWNGVKPDYIKLTRIPAAFGVRGKAYAKLYYTLEALGRGDLHAAVFDTIFRQQESLISERGEQETQRLESDMLRKHGVEADAFITIYTSTKISEQVARAAQVAVSYQIDSVPMIIVNNKYRTSIKHAGSIEKFIKLISDLCSHEHSLSNPSK